MSRIVFVCFSSNLRNEFPNALASGERTGETTTTTAAISDQPSTSSSVNITAVSSATDPDTITTVINISRSVPVETMTTTTSTVAGQQQPSLIWVEESSSSSFAPNMSYQNKVVENEYIQAKMELERKERQLRIDRLKREVERQQREKKENQPNAVERQRRKAAERLNTVGPEETMTTTTSTVAGQQQPSLIWVEESSSASFAPNMSYQNEVVENEYIQAKMELERKEWQLRIDRLKREHQLKLDESEHERSRLKREIERQQREDAERLNAVERQRREATERLNEVERQRREAAERLNRVERERHAYFLRSTEHQRRVDDLTHQLEEMRLCNERLRLTTLKRNPITEKQNAIHDMYNAGDGTDRLEMIVVTRMDSLMYYGFRRKLKAMFSAISKQIRKSHDNRVVLWLVSNNAKQDFNDCKLYLSEEAHGNLKAHNNTIDCSETTGVFEFIHTFRQFANLIGMIELDAQFLQSVCEMSRPQQHQQLRDNKMTELSEFIDTQTEDMFRDIYKYVLNDYKKLNK